MTGDQFDAPVTLLTEIRDRLPRPRSGELLPNHGKTTPFGWAVDGSEGPPTAEQVAMAGEVWRHYVEESPPMPRPAAELHALRAILRACGREF